MPNIRRPQKNQYKCIDVYDGANMLLKTNLNNPLIFIADTRDIITNWSLPIAGNFKIGIEGTIFIRKLWTKHFLIIKFGIFKEHKMKKSSMA